MFRCLTRLTPAQSPNVSVRLADLEPTPGAVTRRAGSVEALLEMLENGGLFDLKNFCNAAMLFIYN